MNTRDVCPDCNADTRIAEIAPGVYVLSVLHDDTCPQLVAREKQDNLPMKSRRTRGAQP